jgi:hypothetical protein
MTNTSIFGLLPSGISTFLHTQKARKEQQIVFLAFVLAQKTDFEASRATPERAAWRLRPVGLDPSPAARPGAAGGE